MMGSQSADTLLVRGAAQGEVLNCVQGLSFWGGVDPDTGVIIDALHPDCGALLTGRIVLMPTSRGSCSGSGVLLQLVRNGMAPAALVFREHEDILTLGALIAERLFNATVVVLRLSPAVFDALSRAPQATIDGLADGPTLRFDDQVISLAVLSTQPLVLSAADRAMRDGLEGRALQIAMDVLCQMAAVQGATGFVDVTRAHIDGCILAHDANLDFAETMQRLGARTRIPTTINAISVDRENWMFRGVDPEFGHKASRLADAYVNMGALPTFTCAPYLLDDAPADGEAIGWSESNAVIYANSVLGARTVKHPDYLDLFIAMTGRAPGTGVYLAENRLPGCEIRVALPAQIDDAFWPMVGWLAGVRSPSQIPLLTGLEAARPTPDDLKALCAAFGTTSAAPMLHLRGHTPEGQLPLRTGAPSFAITRGDLAQVWRDFNAVGMVVPGAREGGGAERVDLVAIGSPHASLAECRRLADLLDGQRCDADTDTILTLGRDVLRAATADGTARRLQDAGVQVIPDLCWCSITEPVLPLKAKVLMTNSGKYAHYAYGLSGRRVRFGSLADCARSALTGRASRALPRWLQESA